MANGTSIEWTQATWNPIAGCTIKSAGCTNCYAMKMAHRLEAMGQAKYRGLTRKVNGKAVWTGVLRFDEEALTVPLRRRKPTTYFVNSMSDLFHEYAPFEWVDKVFAVMALCPQHTFQVLTKRPERAAEYLTGLTTAEGPSPDRWDAARWPLYEWAKRSGVHRLAEYIGVVGAYPRWPLPNVHLLTSVEDQRSADERIPHLLRCPAAVRGLSVEPLIGAVELELVVEARGFMSGFRADGSPMGSVQNTIHANVGIHWVIVGCESQGSRVGRFADGYEAAARSIIEQCRAAGVAVFHKQMPVGNRVSGDPLEWPDDLRVREFPTPNPLNSR